MNQVQEKELGVLKELIKVIEANGIRYCAFAGTCLGAVRHKGFIPWDDDIDILLSRKDYEILRKELYKQLPEYIKKLDYDSSETDIQLYIKFHDTRTTLIEKTVIGNPDRFTGAWVDVFPLDGLPDNPLIKRIWYAIYIFLIISNTRRRSIKEKITDFRSLIKELYGGFLKKYFSYNYFTNVLESFLSKYDISKCKMSTWNVATWAEAKEYIFGKPFEVDFLKDTILVPFEDTMIRIPRRYDDHLTIMYGDYMEFPPESKRNSGHKIAISDMNTPVAYYEKLAAEGEKIGKNK